MRKSQIQAFLSVIFMVAGFLLLFYPDLSNLQKSIVHDAILREYDRMVAQLTPEQIEQQLNDAAIHNAVLGSLTQVQPLLLGEIAPLPANYNETLYVDGLMAWIDIPIIDVSLPVLHGSEPEVLARGVGHLEGTAFPVGGYSTHSVLTAHSGLAGIRMFTNLERLVYGDVFFISVLDQRLAYQVDQINVILPHEIELLRVTPGQDHMTLITCTPFAINTHRLLVRGTRIPYVYEMEDEIVSITISTGLQMRSVIFVAFILIYIFIWRGRRQPPVIPQLS